MSPAATSSEGSAPNSDGVRTANSDGGPAAESPHENDALRMAAARALASEKMPYLSTALFAVTAHASDLVPTMAVDRRWRLYWNPSWCRSLPVNELAGGWLHEIAHLLREHADRFDMLGEPYSQAAVFNIAADAAINVDLSAGYVALPAEAIRLDDVPGGQAGMTAEQFYRLLTAERESKPEPDGARRQRGDEIAGDSGAGDPEDSQDDQDGQEGQDGQAQGGDEQDQDGNEPDDQHHSGAHADGDPDGNQRGAPDGEADGNGSGGPDGAAPGPAGPAPDGKAGGLPEQIGDGLGTGTPADGSRPAVDCGSGVTPGRRAWELADDDGDQGVDDDRADLIRRQVAEEIREFERHPGRGRIPAGMLRWANDILHPRVDWRAELKSLLRREIAAVAGRRDYTYSRPSRRSSTSPDVLLPAMRQPRPPLVSVLIDTSASMSATMLGQCLGEIDEIIVRVGSGGGRPTVTVVACDVGAGVLQAVRAAREISLVGGGGTDLIPGIETLAAQRPRPDLIVILTDGDTPWADDPPAGNSSSRYIAVLVDGRRPRLPTWLKPIVIDESPYRSG